MVNMLQEGDRKCLLLVARQSMEEAVNRETLSPLVWEAFPDRLWEPGATFVTLTRSGLLRGCVGTVQAERPLVEDVRQNAIAAALYDPRFSPVTGDELASINVEIALLSPLQPLLYAEPEDLPHRLCPQVDGVLIRQGEVQATFLPKVWDKIPDRELFLDQLCYKMGVAPDLWRQVPMEVFVYQAESFGE